MPDCTSFAEPENSARRGICPAGHWNDLTNLDTKTSVYFGVCELIARTSKNIRHSEVLSLVFAVLAQTFPGDHYRYRGLSDEVVTERAEQHTATVSLCVFDNGAVHLPFEGIPASRSQNDKRWFKHVNLSNGCQ